MRAEGGIGHGRRAPRLWGNAAALVALLRRRSAAQDTRRDPVTRLFNRSYADVIATRLIAQGEQDGQIGLVLVVLRIDAADEIARRYGRAAVERLLGLIAETVATQCRSADMPYRHGSRELAVLLRCDDIEQAEAFGRRIRMLLASQQLEWCGDILKPSVSQVATACEKGATLDTLYRRVEAALDA